MELLTRQQVAERLQVSYRKAGCLMRTMPTVRVGERLRVAAADLDQWVRSMRELPGTVETRNRKPSPAARRSGALVDGRIPRRTK